MAKAPQIVTQAAGLSQSSVMGAALIAGFLIYLGLEGKLGNYWSILMGGSATTQAAPTTAPGVTPDSTKAPSVLTPPATLAPGSTPAPTPGKPATAPGSQGSPGGGGGGGGF